MPVSRRPLALLMLAAFLFAACRITPTPPAGPTQAIASVPQDQLQAALAQLARSHRDKIRLAFGVSTPFKPVDPLFKTFYQNMGTQNSALLSQLTAWADDHHISLAFHYPDTLQGRAQKLLDAREEKLARSENQEDFQRHMLIQMSADYAWNLALIDTLLPAVHDPALKAYLDKSRRMYQSGAAEIQGLLRHYTLTK